MVAATAAKAPALEVEGLGVRYGALIALEDVSWAVHPGELLGIIGDNLERSASAAAPDDDW